jgi:hypothetical protein
VGYDGEGSPAFYLLVHVCLFVFEAAMLQLVSEIRYYWARALMH